MNNGLKSFLMFTVGAAAGSLVTWKLLKTTYERIAQEEIDSVKEVYYKAAEEAMNILDEADKAQKEYEEGSSKNKPNMKKYSSMISNLSYVNSKEDNTDEDEEYEDDDRPYVISPDEFGEFEDYEQISLTYYADGILADEMDNEIEDVDNIVGLDSLDTFGKYEDDSVYVRNDSLKCDYEILADNSNYSDIIERQ